jgi:hypothetical protein
MAGPRRDSGLDQERGPEGLDHLGDRHRGRRVRRYPGLRQKGSLHAVHGDQLWPIRIMGIAFLAAGIAALYAVFPNLKRSQAKAAPG